MAHALHFMLEPMIKHVENNHKPFIDEQHTELNHVAGRIDKFFKDVLKVIEEKTFENLDALIKERDE